MLNKNQQRELAYLVKIDDILTIVGSDNCECAVVGGWRVMVKKGTFKKDGVAIYFEIDSLVDLSNPAFEFMGKYKGRVKTQKYTFGGKGLMISQGLLMHPADLGWGIVFECPSLDVEIGIKDNDNNEHYVNDESRFVTELLNIHYYDPEDEKRKKEPKDKVPQMPKFFRTKLGRWLMRHKFTRKLCIKFFSKKKKKSESGWPVGKFPGVSKTDQERVENMKWVLQDKTPYIRTQKCDGSSGTFILERKKRNKFEFYVCSRNVRMFTSDQESFYKEKNYYWEVAIKYDIENKLKDYLEKNPDIWFVCWQGEICAPGIQGNPHHLGETHLFLFHLTDSKTGRFDIRKAKEIWDYYGMETVPIDKELYILPDNMEEFKITADGFYDPSVCGFDTNTCQGKTDCPREGFVYYKSTDPTFSFKNVSRQYLLTKG